MCVPIELLSMLLSQCEVTTILKNTQFSRYDICKIFNKNKKIGNYSAIVHDKFSSLK